MNDHEYDSHEFEWEFRHLVIVIEVRLKPQSLGNDFDHLEIRSKHPERCPLPMTETGYRSHWAIHGEYASAEEAAKAVHAWLDEEAEKAEWLEFVTESEQPSLF